MASAGELYRDFHCTTYHTVCKEPHGAREAQEMHVKIKRDNTYVHRCWKSKVRFFHFHFYPGINETPVCCGGKERAECKSQEGRGLAVKCEANARSPVTKEALRGWVRGHVSTLHCEYCHVSCSPCPLPEEAPTTWNSSSLSILNAS